MIKDQRILILGGSGSLGHALTNRYLGSNKLYIFSRGENTQWQMKQTFKNHPDLTFFIGDIRDEKRLENCLFRFQPNIIIIAAALKHIDMCENNISECIDTNVNGIQNVVKLITTNAMQNAIPFLHTVVFISTDKACSPVNSYGMCKSLSERIVVENTSFLQSPKFINVRYGNVISSRGSIIPLYKNMANDPTCTSFPVTHPDMTRFFMTLDESVNLIEHAILFGSAGDTVIPKNIFSCRILDVARYFSEKYKKPVAITKIRPGEKLHETLINYTESLRTIDAGSYYIIKPTYMDIVSNIVVTFPFGEFNSTNTLCSPDKISIDSFV